jgi:hypothetical protein
VKGSYTNWNVTSEMDPKSILVASRIRKRILSGSLLTGGIQFKVEIYLKKSKGHKYVTCYFNKK